MKNKSSLLVYKNAIDSTRKNQSDNFNLIPYFNLYKDRIVVTPRYDSKMTHKIVSEKSKINLKKEKLTGVISCSSKKKIEKQLTTWIESINTFNEQKINQRTVKKHYPIFLTLTLSAKQNHTDNEIKRKILMPFIEKLKYNYAVKYYFWRAESQKNGNIHFHMIVDKYIDIESVKHYWNLAQEKLGYISEFEKKHNHTNPNSIDVRSARSVQNFVKYVLKYSLKDSNDRKINGRLWGMSDELRILKGYRDVIDTKINSLLNKYIIEYQPTVFYSEHFTIFYLDDNYHKTELFRYLNEKLTKYYLSVYDYLYIHPPCPDLTSFVLSYDVPDPIEYFQPCIDF